MECIEINPWCQRKKCRLVLDKTAGYRLGDGVDNSDFSYNFPLKSRTANGWAATALTDFGAFLQDHAQCERKAAALCMSFVSKYPDQTILVDPMISLAREELEHFVQVFRLMQKRNLSLVPAERDIYVNKMIEEVRPGGEARLLDRLIVSGLIEARSSERLQLVGEALTDAGLREFYLSLARSEAGHYRVFFRLAERIFPQEDVKLAVDRLTLAEDRALKESPWRSAVH